jgi:hypothetical protein
MAGLQDLLKVTAAELTTLRASVPDPEAVDDDTLTRITELHQFGLTLQEEIAARVQKAAAFRASELTIVETPAAVVASVEPVVEPVVEEVIVAAAQGAPVLIPSLSDVVAAQTPAQQTQAVAQAAPEAWMGDFHSLVAANNIPGIADGREMQSWAEFAAAFSARTRTYSGSNPLQHPIAEIRRHFNPDFVLTEEMSAEVMQDVIKRASDESNLPGGSLVAANGWCAPSETLYSTCLQIGTDGMWQGPEVLARRGGIRHNQGIEFDSIFGTGVGFNELTEAQVIADVTKTCVEIPCPPFVDDRLKVTVLCLTGAILQNRAYPEFVNTFVQGALATYAHFVNREIIADIVAGSGAPILLNGVDPWVTDGSVVSQVLGAVELAIVDIQYRLRMTQGSTIEIVLPYWLRALFRQDFSRRPGFDGVGLTDAEINNWFSMRNARVQWVYDWQDAFSGVATGPGADTPILTLPALTATPTLDFLAYPAGTWVLARQDVIRLESIYDSVNLPQNLVTQLFMEDGWAVMRMCPLSRLYRVNLCPTGATGAQHTIACADVTP